MISPPPAGSRRTRYTRSPSGGDVPALKRSKPSNSNDRDHGSKSDQHRVYTSICVKNINPKISDLGRKIKVEIYIHSFCFLRYSRFMY
jgi:hypothetical protein